MRRPCCAAKGMQAAFRSWENSSWEPARKWRLQSYNLREPILPKTWVARKRILYQSPQIRVQACLYLDISPVRPKAEDQPSQPKASGLQKPWDSMCCLGVTFYRIKRKQICTNMHKGGTFSRPQHHPIKRQFYLWVLSLPPVLWHPYHRV